MKRILATCMALVMMLSFSAIAFAGDITGVNSAASLFPNGGYALSPMQGGSYIALPLGASAFTGIVSGDFSQVSLAQVQKLVLNVDGGPAKASEFYSLFTPSFIQVKNDLGAVTGVSLLLVSKAVTAETAYSFKVSAYFPAAVPGAYHSTGLGTISGKLTAPPAPAYPITGLNSTTDRSTMATTPGGMFQLSLPSGFFRFRSDVNPPVITTALLENQAVKARSTNANFTAGIYQSGGVPLIQVQALPGLAGGVYTTSIVLSGTGISEGTLVTLDITVSSNAVSKITGIDPDARLGYVNAGIFSRVSRNGALLGYGEDMGNLTIRAGDEINFEFDSDFFLWEKGKPSPPVAVNASMIRGGRITAKVTGGRNSAIVESAQIRYQNGAAYLQLKFVDHFVSTADKDFSVTLSLAYNGTTSRSSEAVVAGTIQNEYISVYANTDYVDLSYGDVAYAEESVSRIQADLGHGVLINARMAKGKKYYGVVDTEPTREDERIMRTYPDIDMVYNLKTVGFNSTSNTVTLETPVRYYVYNRDLEYLGTTTSKLPYSTKYYLALRQLNIKSSETDPPVVESSPGGGGSGGSSSSFTPQIPTGPTPGGGASYPSVENPNGNPMVGR